MNKLIIHKNKGESFRCQFKAEGTEAEGVTIRLCLEFSDNKNMFFYGEVDSGGNCVINIPPLAELKNKEGKLTVEAIADSMYFKLYESQVEIKNSVEVKMEGVLSRAESPKSSVELQNIYKEERKEKPRKSAPKQQADESVDWEPLVHQRRTRPEKLVEDTEEASAFVGNSNLRSFSDWKKNRAQ